MLSVQKLPCQREPSCGFLVGSQLENVQAQADKETKRDGEKQGGLQAFQRSYRIWQKKEERTKQIKIHLVHPETKPRREALCSQWVPTAFICTHFSFLCRRFCRAVPSHTPQLTVGKRTLLSQCHRLCQRQKSRFCHLGFFPGTHGSLGSLPSGQGNGDFPNSCWAVTSELLQALLFSCD